MYGSMARICLAALPSPSSASARGRCFSGIHKSFGIGGVARAPPPPAPPPFAPAAPPQARAALPPVSTATQWRPLAASEGGECRLGRLEGCFQVCVGMGQRAKRGLELRGRQINATLKHAVEESSKLGHVRLLRAGVIEDRTFG